MRGNSEPHSTDTELQDIVDAVNRQTELYIAYRTNNNIYLILIFIVSIFIFILLGLLLLIKWLEVRREHPPRGEEPSRPGESLEVEPLLEEGHQH